MKANSYSFLPLSLQTFNFTSSLALEASYGILNSITNPPADKQYEVSISFHILNSMIPNRSLQIMIVNPCQRGQLLAQVQIENILLDCQYTYFQLLLIKFASVFVPFMEELDGYYARPDEVLLHTFEVLVRSIECNSVRKGEVRKKSVFDMYFIDVRFSVRLREI